MSRNHDFLLLSRDEYPTWYDATCHHRPEAILLHDDILHYIGDSLQWIPCHSPGRRGKLVEFCGLDLYGPTVIKEEGAEKARQIFSLWAELFSHSPEVLELRGLWSWTDGEPESGRYDRMVLQRDELVGRFRAIADLAKQVAESEGGLYILHLGI